MPAAVVVLLVLGAIAVDSAIAFLGQRELAGLAAAAANDAATAALSEDRFYRGPGRGERGRVEIDPDAARQLVEQAVLRGSPPGIRDIAVDTRTAGRQLCVVLRGRVDHVFARGIPGASRHTTVEARAVATAVEGPAGTAVARGLAC